MIPQFIVNFDGKQHVETGNFPFNKETVIDLNTLENLRYGVDCNQKQIEYVLINYALFSKLYAFHPDNFVIEKSFIAFINSIHGNKLGYLEFCGIKFIACYHLNPKTMRIHYNTTNEGCNIDMFGFVENEKAPEMISVRDVNVEIDLTTCLNTPVFYQSIFDTYYIPNRYIRTKAPKNKLIFLGDKENKRCYTFSSKLAQSTLNHIRFAAKKFIDMQEY